MELLRGDDGMKSLEEYRKELEKDPKAKRKLAKLEKEYREVEKSLTEEELVKYGLKEKPDDGGENKKTAAEDAAADVLGSIMRKI